MIPRLDHLHNVVMALRVGDRLPSFSLLDQDGERRSSDDLAGRPLVLFFYPKDDTPGCTIEACSFRDNHCALNELGAVIWGVSADDAVSHRRFVTRHSLPYPLLCDTNNALRRSLGVPRAMGLLPGRVTYVVDGEGIIRHVIENLLDGPAHVRESLRVLNNLAAAPAA